MTVYVVCAIRDRAMDAYMQPFFTPSVGVAVRSFADELNRPDAPMKAHPEDYDLYHLGYYDDHKGEFSTSGDTGLYPRQIAIGKEHVRA